MRQGGGEPAPGRYTREEIMTQTGLWEGVIAATKARWSELGPLFGEAERVVFTGCGSNYYMSLGAAFHFQSLAGIPAVGVPASELLLFPEVVLRGEERTLVVTLCRSGETTEVVRAVEAARRRPGVRTLYLGCAPDSTVAGLCSAALGFPEARDRSVVTTRSHTAMLLGVQVLAGLSAAQGRKGAGGGATGGTGAQDADAGAYLRELDRLPGLGRGLLERLAEVVEAIPVDRYGQFVFLGGGPFYGIACEGMLKMKEMAIVPSDGFHCLEFRHGPKSILDPGVLVTVFLSDTARREELELIREIRLLGGSVLGVCEQAGEEVAAVADFVAATGSSI
ncbi:MAG: SIS domain-containing protein, partial [Spirochaetales bacterium]|nr:SIS domain-containing protein [Spirochaetales bacterium]